MRSTSEQPAEPGQHDLRALLLREPGDVEGDRGVGDHAGDQQAFAVEQSHGLSSVLSGESVAHAEAAVDRDHRAGDVPGGVRAEPGDRGRDLLDRGVAAQRDLAEDLRAAGLGQRAVMSVSTNPGATTLAVMLRDPSSRAIERASPTSPALDAA